MNKNYIIHNFNTEVKSKFDLCNSIFLGLSVNTSKGNDLVKFKELISRLIMDKKSPSEIIEHFKNAMSDINDQSKLFNLLFDFIKIIERQVVIFDAIEDSAFSKINDLNGSNSINFVLKDYLFKGEQESLTETLKKSRIRFVLTAHPTQFYPGTILTIINELESTLRKEELLPISELLSQLAYTPFFKKDKPSPFDEALNSIWYLNNVFYDAIIEIQQKINILISDEDGELINDKLVELGFWPGGDRDGNPFVTAAITKKVALKLKQSILTKYVNEIRILKRKLTFEDIHTYLSRIENTLIKEIHEPEGCLVNVHDFLDDLHEIKNILNEKFEGIYLNDINRVINIVKIFRFHFASIDIRQDSRVHQEVFSTLLALNNIYNNYADLDENAKLNFLNSFSGEATDYGNDIAAETIETIQTIKEIQHLNGEESVHRYIISNCNYASDVMLLYRLFTLSGWDANKLAVDLVPLFETIEALEDCDKIMEKLYLNEVYMSHLKKRNNKQHIMLGFSDGTKDGGYFTANWSIFKAKEVITEVSRKFGIEVIFFDGRGGPAARGGGKTHEYYAAHSQKISSNEIQLTIQGQTVSSNFGTQDSAIYNIEQLLSARIKNELDSSYHADFEEGQRKLMEEISEISHNQYLKLKNDDKFLDYYQRFTPINYFGKTNIGSRPDKRKSSASLKLENLRAIPFVGSWSMNKQNVPGYYGFGNALKQINDNNGKDTLTKLYKDSRFFRTLVENSQMVLEKSNFEVSDYITNDAEFKDIYSEIRQEYETAKEMLLEVSKSSDLMDKNPKDRLSVRLRESITLPLVIIQKYALQQMNEQLSEEEKETYLKMIVRCSFGIINASRNSA
jgi:phosphoenolpyruvate carboxylase